MNDLITKNSKEYTAMINCIAECSHRKFVEIYKRDNNGTRIKTTADENWIKLHGTDQADLAKLTFDEVPNDWKKERWLGAKTALDILLTELDNGKTLDNNLIEYISAKIHDDWLARNNERAESEHKVPYDQLSEKAKEKDRLFVLSAIEIYKEHISSNNKLIIKTLILFIIGPCLVLFYLPYIITEHYNDLGPRNIISYLAILFWLVGLYLIYKSVKNFIVAGKGTPAHWDAPKDLVNKDIYTLNRNPMYSGAVLFMLGTFIWTQIFWLLFYALCFWFAFHLSAVFYEEPNLKKQFGQPFLDYIKNTPRWIPKFKK